MKPRTGNKLARNRGRPVAERVAAWRARRVPLRQAPRNIETNPAVGNETAPKPVAKPVLLFRRILVPIDFSAESTRALKIAASLGPSEGGSLLLVHVVGPNLRDLDAGPVQRRPNEGVLRHAKQRLQALGRRHVGEKREWSYVLRSGMAPRQVLKAAEEFRADLVVMPTRGLSHAPPAQVGSTAERVVRHALCPVLVLPKPGPRKKKQS